MKKALVLTALTAALAAGAARASDTISLPAAQTKGGMPLMEALASRHSSRSFAPGDLSAQELSNLLWAAWGVNRSDGRRTIPTAMNRQELEVYVNRRDGVWRYEAAGQRLVRAAPRALPSPMNDAPEVLIFAIPAGEEYGPYHAGLAAQSAGLYCAGAKLACVVRASPVKAAEKADPKAFGFLPKGWKPSLTLHAGHPAK
ncbi:nitroreductase family protein [Mesosutterella sp. AGMB02718]|uniref:Nitroreductase family protein n=1 Tax=Mesosutterella faecium TaxID=2925194 RepID=A0ABT7INZ1_9BURK|nr:nitroreductase family protein [Mesosutterella sp. AGMB02718]MDL2060095.1 nitroreductase family protein [Mesosutterella sp. AGMB02718]